MYKNKMFILTVINFISFFIFKNANLLGIGGYDVYRLSYIIPLYYNYLIMPVIVFLIIFYYVYKFVKRKYAKNELIIFFMNIVLALLFIADKNSLPWWK
jgi:membrane-associated HD superfamily phosphohydrolase